MNLEKLKKYLIVLIFILAFIILLNSNVYADGFELEDVDVKLNSSKSIPYTGGTGTITWSSADENIASVSTYGTVTGNAIGTTTITAVRGEETDTCTVNVVYYEITIYDKTDSSVSSIYFVMGEHETEQLSTKVYDGQMNEVEDAEVTWTSSDTSVATVDNTGRVTAVGAGTATITATAAGVSDSCTANVEAAPAMTDFSNAKYELNFENLWSETLKITGITPSNKNHYYCIVTPNRTQPTISLTQYGYVDTEEMGDSIEYLTVNTDDNYIYSYHFEKYAELNQDLYLWVIEEARLTNGYTDDNDNSIYATVKIVESGKKLERAALPPLNLIMQSINIGKFTGGGTDDSYTYIRFNYPTDTQNRKFTLKIGRITDTDILNKVQKGDSTGLTSLLTYAKNHDAIYSKKLTTTTYAYFRSDSELFNGRNLLVNKGYYYIYVELDDENGKYYPIEGVTVGQAYLSSLNNSWNLYAYTSSDFDWSDLKPTSTPSTTKPTNTTPTTKPTTTTTTGKDTTTATGTIPQTGKEVITIALIAITTVVIVVSAIQYKKHRI